MDMNRMPKSLPMLIREAQSGNVDSQSELGHRYNYGLGTPKDLNRAFHWHMKAAMQGNAYSQFNVGCYYRDGKVVKADAGKSIEWFAKGAENGDMSSQYNLGVIYLFGLGVKPDLDKARRWITLAADTGDADALNALGQCCMYGDRIVSFNETMKGNIPGQNLKKAFQCFSASAKKGNMHAKYNLSCLYAKGFGAEKNTKMSMKLFLEAAKQGHPLAKKALSGIEKKKWDKTDLAHKILRCMAEHFDMSPDELPYSG